MRLSRKQMAAPLMADEDALVGDVIEYLSDRRPETVAAYPPGYFVGLVRESIRLARRHGMDDVEHIRLFIDLRWEIAAGWFRQPQIAEVLSRPGQTGAQRFAVLTQPAYDLAWDAAEDLDGPDHWRGDLWSGGDRD